MVPIEKIIIQIYEVQTPSEAEKLIQMGVNHIGSVIVSPEEFKNPMIKATIATIKNNNCRSSLIPLFSDMDTISQVLDYYQPHIVHFCEALVGPDGGAVNVDKYVALQGAVKHRFPEVQITRSIPIPVPGRPSPVSALEIARLFEPVSDYFLTDTLLGNASETSSDHQPVKGFVGITGQICDWEIAAQLVKSSRIPVILAGGISPDNVCQGILHVRPFGVDSCTLTNAVDENGSPRRFKKDIDKVKHFVGEVRRAEKNIRNGN